MRSRHFYAIVCCVCASANAAGQAQAPRETLRRDVAAAAIPGVVAAGSKWQLVWQGPDNADGIVGTPDGGLLFAQEQSSRVRKLDANGVASVYLETTHGGGALAIDTQGRVLAVERTCTDPGLAPTPGCNEPTVVGVLAPEHKVLAASFEGKPFGRPNDLVVDKKGGVYFTVGGAYYVSPGGLVTSLGDNIRSNGIMLSPDEKIVYVTNGTVFLAFDILSGGRVTNRRDFGKLEGGGNGDGMAVDAVGRLYVTTGPGVQVFGPEGRYLGLIPTPRAVISVALPVPTRRPTVVGSGAFVLMEQAFQLPAGTRKTKDDFQDRCWLRGFKGRAK